MTKHAKKRKSKALGKNLRKRIAEPTLAGVRSRFSESVSSNLSPAKLGNIIREVDSGGDISNYLTLAEEMEERDLHYRSVLSQRKLAVGSLDITVEAAGDDERSMKHADLVRSVVSHEGVMRPLLANLLDALGKGFSVCEIIWDKTGDQWEPIQYIYRTQKFFQFDRVTGTEIRLRDMSNIVEGVELKPYKFITHVPLIKSGLPIRGGLARLAAVAYMCKGYSMKDWLAFAEVYGMPLRLGKYDASASDEQKAELLDAVSNLGTDAAAIIPENMKIEFMDGARQMQGVGEGVFERLANWLDKQVSKGVLGQTQTTDVGGSYAQAKVHDNVRHDIVQNDARQLSASLCRDLAMPLIDLNFGPQPRGKYPTIKIASEDAEDLELLAKALPPFIKLGLPVAASDILDKFGLDAPEEGAEILGEPGKDTENTTPKTKDEEPKPEEKETSDPEMPADDALKATDDEEKMKMRLHEKILRGEPLTDDQRALLESFSTHDKYQDTIDEIVQSDLKDWEKIANPMLNPLIELANSSKDFAEFASKLALAAKQMDLNPATKAVAESTLKARSLGDTKDKL